MDALKKKITGIIGKGLLDAGSKVPGDIADEIMTLIAKSDGGAEVTLDCRVMCDATNGGRKLSRQYHDQQENLKNGECVFCRKPLFTKRHCKECAEKARTLARNRYRKKVGIKLDAPLCGPRRKKRT